MRLNFSSRVVYPKKYPYPIPENFGSKTGIYPILYTRKIFPMGMFNTRHPYSTGFSLGYTTLLAASIETDVP